MNIFKEIMDEFKMNKIINTDKDGLGSSPLPLWIDVSEKTAKPTLVCLYDGEFAIKTQADDSKSDDDIVDEALQYLAAALGKSVESIPNR